MSNGPDASKPHSGGAKYSRPLILLAEDSDDDVLLLERAFEKTKIDHQLVRVKDGEEALKYLMGEDEYSNRARYPFPSLLLLDLEMPKMNGMELLQRVRSIRTWKKLPIVILTISTYSPHVKRAYELGADSFITKPQQTTELVAALDQMASAWLPQPPAAEI
jgi:CheY-like chemotaxis protein